MAVSGTNLQRLRLFRHYLALCNKISFINLICSLGFYKCVLRWHDSCIHLYFSLNDPVFPKSCRLSGNKKAFLLDFVSSVKVVPLKNRSTLQMHLKVVCEAVPKVLLVQCLWQFTGINNPLYDLISVVRSCGFVWFTVVEILFPIFCSSVFSFLFM